ncbi:MAG TPA: 4Fe-4S dicluster domain-containing protein [Acidobacteriota bacterium]|nr:4Fe-4S dicluster domain-containing protein [Acidobacteriota bacterium]
MKDWSDNAIWRWLLNFFKPSKGSEINLGRRKVLVGGTLGVSAACLSRVHPQASGRAFDPALIRPPGAVDEQEFLSRCIRCGVCMKVCPTNAIQPVGLEAGIEGLWTPVLNMNIGYCEYECTLCGQVCPTDAIRELPLEEKQKIKIGQSFIDKNRCLPYASARLCIVCEEHCPTPTKAIWVEVIEVTNESGQKVFVQQPHVDPELCVGCGICQNKCPIKDQSGIYVTSVGETRNSENQMLL